MLFLEPSEMVVTSELHNVAAMSRRDVSYEIGPMITLIDGPCFQEQWHERRSLLVGQITGADIVAISRCDLLDTEALSAIRKTLGQYVDGLLELSTIKNIGVTEMVDRFSDLHPITPLTPQQKGAMP